jgi:predicted metal-binding protein
LSDRIRGLKDDPMRRVVSAVLMLFLATATAHAGASSANFGEPPADPKTKSMSKYQAKLWVFDRCLIQQSRLQSKTREQVHSACSCYSSRVVDQMNKTEFAFFKEKSYFDDTTREKGFKAIDACKLTRP